MNEEGGYTVTIPEAPGCISEGDTLEEAFAMIKDALAGWLYVARKHGDPIPAQFQDVMRELGVLEELKIKSS